MGKKYTLLFITILCVGFSISAGTYAYWTWTSNVNKNVSFNVVSGFEQYIIYDEGDSYFVGDFQPSVNYCDGLKNTISFKKTNNDVNFQASINMDVNAIENNIKNSDFVYWVVTSGDDTSCTGNLDDALAYGTFKNKVNGSVIEMLNNVEVTTSEQKFTIWIWIDSSGSNLSDLSGQTLDTNIWTQFDMLDSNSSGNTSSGYTETLLNGADPVLDDGMVPIVLSDTGVATVADISSEWYNYEDREWANAVLVNENATSGVDGSYSREYYLNNPGTTVAETDILAYYVWIPRYKYQIWTTSTSSNGSEQTIEIIFEGKDDEKSNGTAVGEFKTHPAFTFGDEELAGIWVGKFETTGNATTPTVKPNLQSLRNQNVSTQFQTALKFAGGTLTNGTVSFTGNNTYGLTTNTDSHMMKNSEWGAVAYLSRSLYGTNQEIYINNSSSYYTGRSGGNVGGSVNTVAIQYPDDSTSTNQYYNYGYYTWLGQEVSYTGVIGDIVDISYGGNASTTGNLTGVYDMSGGAWEYTMGVLSDSNGNPRSGNSTSYNSGFNGIIYDSGNNTEKTDGILFPTEKYYDLYTTTDKLTACGGSICYGHALSETSSWYGDYAYFVSASDPWFLRSGAYFNGAGAGAFYSDYGYGDASIGDSWRSVLVVGDGA